MSGFSTFDFSACGVNIGIQKEGKSPFVETPPALPSIADDVVADDEYDTLKGVADDGVTDGEAPPLIGVTEYAAALSASVKDPVSFLYLLYTIFFSAFLNFSNADCFSAAAIS